MIYAHDICAYARRVRPRVGGPLPWGGPCHSHGRAAGSGRLRPAASAHLLGDVRLLVLGSWVSARRPFHLSLFLTASRTVVPQDHSTDPTPLCVRALRSSSASSAALHSGACSSTERPSAMVVSCSSTRCSYSLRACGYISCAHAHTTQTAMDETACVPAATAPDSSPWIPPPRRLPPNTQRRVYSWISLMRQDGVRN